MSYVRTYLRCFCTQHTHEDYDCIQQQLSCSSLLSKCDSVMARAGAPATEVAREAIQAWLNEDRRRQQRTELADFVATTA